MPEREIEGVLPARPGESLVLLAGQLYFGRTAASLRTLLGSCVGITLWHPVQRLAGMCHFLLPSRTRPAGPRADARYGDEALSWLVRAIERAGTRPCEYRTGLYGGADTMPHHRLSFNIGERNIALGWQLLEQHGFDLAEVDVGDNVPRHVQLSLATGEVQLRRGQPLPQTAAARAA